MEWEEEEETQNYERREREQKMGFSWQMLFKGREGWVWVGCLASISLSLYYLCIALSLGQFHIPSHKIFPQATAGHRKGHLNFYNLRPVLDTPPSLGVGGGKEAFVLERRKNNRKWFHKMGLGSWGSGREQVHFNSWGVEVSRGKDRTVGAVTNLNAKWMEQLGAVKKSFS